MRSLLWGVVCLALVGGLAACGQRVYPPKPADNIADSSAY